MGYLMFFIFWGLALTAVSHFHEVMALSDTGLAASVSYGWPFSFETRSYVIGCWDCDINLYIDYFLFASNVLFWMLVSFLFLIIAGRISKKSYIPLIEPRSYMILGALILSGMTIAVEVFDFGRLQLPVAFSVLNSLDIDNMLWNYDVSVNYAFFYLDIAAYFIVWYVLLTFIFTVLNFFRSSIFVRPDRPRKKRRN